MPSGFGAEDKTNVLVLPAEDKSQPQDVTAFLQSSSSVSVIFASQYAGNPASIMGHTFLKFNDPRIAENLLPTVNYGANVPENEGPMGYVFRGLFGGFDGQYGLESYFQKKKEYRDIENRHLWEYELNLSDQELESLKSQIAKDFQGAGRPYYFLDQNCSFELIQQIEKVRSGPRFTDKEYFFVLPHETVRWLDLHGYLKPPRFLPSLRSQMLDRFENLNPSEKAQVLRVWSSRSAEQTLSPEQLDVLLFRLQMEEYRSGGSLPEKLKGFEESLLIMRAQLPRSSHLSVATPTNPAHSHRPHLLQLAGSDTHLGVLLSPGIHHIFQDEAGFTPNTELSFLELEWSLKDQLKQGSLDRITLLNLSSWIEYASLDPKPSWRVRFFDQKEAYSPDPHRTQRFEGSYGLGAQVYDISFSFLLGPLAVASSTPKVFEGSRVQWRILASYQHRRVWRASWELFNSSEQLSDKFADSENSLFYLIYLNALHQIDLGLRHEYIQIDDDTSHQVLSAFSQYNF